MCDGTIFKGPYFLFYKYEYSKMSFTIGKGMICTLREDFSLYVQEFRVEEVGSKSRLYPGILILIIRKLKMMEVTEERGFRGDIFINKREKTNDEREPLSINNNYTSHYILMYG